jgi:hypothetical protein
MKERISRPRTFAQVWKEKERQGYRYGEEALATLKFGWQLAANECLPYILYLERELAKHEKR